MTNTKLTSRVIRRALPREDRTTVQSKKISEIRRGTPRCVTNGRARQAANLARRDRLVLEHLVLVKAIAVNKHQKLPVQVELDDLVQAGIVGLLDAANKFNPARQDVFSVYAKHRIKGAILDSLRQLDWASRDTRRKRKQIEAAKHELEAILLRAPTEPEIAAKLDMSLNHFHAMMLKENIGPVSADTYPDHWDDLPAVEFPSKPGTHPDVMWMQKELRSTLDETIETLPERYRKVIRLYYTKELTMKEIGAVLGVNESRVSQMHKEGLSQMSVVLQAKGIDSIRGLQK